MSRVLMVVSEAAPFAKTGGLADMVGALAPALRAMGEDVAVLLPRYGSVSTQGLTRVYDDLRVWLGLASYPASLYQATERGVPYYFLDCPGLFDRDGLYGDGAGDYRDNATRFAVFARGALAVVRRVFRPEVIHCHDWQAALVPVFVRTQYALDPTYLGLKTLLTIHNLGYQGVFERSATVDVGLDNGVAEASGVAVDGTLNLLRGGLVSSDALATVSRKYAEEIQTAELGFGLEGVLQSRADALTGILNGVDYSVWDPRTDQHIAAHYSPANMEGKRACKADLLDELGLPEENMERPLIGIVSRFAGQKGFDLMEQIATPLLEEDVCLAVLGTGEPRYEQMFLDLAAAYADRVGVRIAYDNALAHKIEAGADMFLMPSHYEPSGLTQLYALRYGTIPLVRATGGLDDTIDRETGFKFAEYSGAALLEAVRAALAVYRNRAKWGAMVDAAMSRDYSWRASAAEYAALYRRLAM